MKLALALVFAVAAAPAFASSAPRILDCAFTTECQSAEGTCTTQEEALLSFALIVALEGDSAQYEGDDTSPPMAVHYTQDGVLVAFDSARSTLTSVGAEGAAVHSANLILLARDIRASQWSGTCLPR
ncbi:MAG: hypothetical protein ACK4GT_02015 [Pararhodobacter sp.]